MTPSRHQGSPLLDAHVKPTMSFQERYISHLNTRSQNVPVKDRSYQGNFLLHLEQTKISPRTDIVPDVVKTSSDPIGVSGVLVRSGHAKRTAKKTVKKATKARVGSVISTFPMTQPDSGTSSLMLSMPHSDLEKRKRSEKVLRSMPRITKVSEMMFDRESSVQAGAPSISSPPVESLSESCSPDHLSGGERASIQDNDTSSRNPIKLGSPPYGELDFVFWDRHQMHVDSGEDPESDEEINNHYIQMMILADNFGHNDSDSDAEMD